MLEVMKLKDVKNLSDFSAYKKRSSFFYIKNNDEKIKKAIKDVLSKATLYQSYKTDEGEERTKYECLSCKDYSSIKRIYYRSNNIKMCDCQEFVSTSNIDERILINIEEVVRGENLLQIGLEMVTEYIEGEFINLAYRMYDISISEEDKKYVFEAIKKGSIDETFKRFKEAWSRMIIKGSDLEMAGSVSAISYSKRYGLRGVFFRDGQEKIGLPDPVVSKWREGLYYNTDYRVHLLLNDFQITNEDKKSFFNYLSVDGELELGNRYKININRILARGARLPMSKPFGYYLEDANSFKTIRRVERDAKKRRKLNKIDHLIPDKFNDEEVIEIIRNSEFGFEKLVEKGLMFYCIEDAKENKSLSTELNGTSYKIKAFCPVCKEVFYTNIGPLDKGSIDCPNQGNEGLHPSSISNNVNYFQVDNSYKKYGKNVYVFENRFGNPLIKFIDIYKKDKLYVSNIYDVVFNNKPIDKKKAEKYIDSGDILGLLDGFTIDNVKIHSAIYNGRSIKYLSRFIKGEAQPLVKESFAHFDYLGGADGKGLILWNRDSATEVKNSLDINKYGAVDYYAEDVLGLSGDFALTQYHFFPKGYPSMFLINQSFELIMKDPSFVDLFLDLINGVGSNYSKSYLANVLASNAKNSKAALKLTGDNMNVLNQFLDEYGYENITLDFVQIIHACEDLIKTLNYNLDKDYRVSYDLFSLYYEVISGVYNSKYAIDHFSEVLESDLSYVINILEDSEFDININSLFRYIKDLKPYQGILAEEGIGIWRDYISIAIDLEYELNKDRVMYPNSLKREHDVANMNYRSMMNGDISVSLKESYYKNKQLEWEDDEFAIILPQESKELILEGARLNHCVGSYTDRVLRGNTTIVFLRRKENIEEPFFTIEVSNKNRIVQANTKHNQNIRDYVRSTGKREVGKFFSQWVAEKGLKSTL